jgi:hypothetical protein
VKLSERYVQCPLLGPHLAKTIEREVDAFPNTDSGETSQQEGVGIKGVGPAQFLLKSSIIIRRQGSGEIFRTYGKVLAEDKTGREPMTLEGQVIQQPTKTE